MVAVAVVAGLGFELVSNPGGNVTNSSNLTTSATSVALVGYCGSTGTYRVVPQLQTGPFYFRVATDQGATVANGSLLITHWGINGSGLMATTNYCLHLRPNATGFMQVATNYTGIPETGFYNVTFTAGYDQGPGYQGFFALRVPESATTYVTVMVPSGKISGASCSGGSCTTITMSATSTSIVVTGSSTQSGAQTETSVVTKTITDLGPATTTTTSCSQTSFVTVTLITTRTIVSTQTTTIVVTTTTVITHVPQYVSTVTNTNCAATTETATMTTTSYVTK